MKTLDRIFLLLFARYRRKLGVDSIELAWRRAANQMSGYMVFPIATAATVLVLAVYWITGTGTSIEHKHTGQIVGGVAAVVVAYLLNQRFRKYLKYPPTVSSFEASADRQLLFWFRVGTVGMFFLACIAGYLLFKVGFPLT